MKRVRALIAVSFAVLGCKGGSDAPEPASVVREETSAAGETRLLCSGGVGDLDGDGTMELIAGGFSPAAGGRQLRLGRFRHRDHDTRAYAQVSGGPPG
jgi:hypothetical protein